MVGVSVAVAGLVGCGGEASRSGVGVITGTPAKTQAAKTARARVSVDLPDESSIGDGVFDLANRQGTLSATVPGVGPIEVMEDGSTWYEKLPALLSTPDKPWIRLDVATSIAKLGAVNPRLFTEALASDPVLSLSLL